MVIKSFANFLCTFIIKRIGGQKPFIQSCHFGQNLKQAAEVFQQMAFVESVYQPLFVYVRFAQSPVEFYEMPHGKFAMVHFANDTCHVVSADFGFFIICRQVAFYPGRLDIVVM